MAEDKSGKKKEQASQTADTTKAKSRARRAKASDQQQELTSPVQHEEQAEVGATPAQEESKQEAKVTTEKSKRKTSSTSTAGKRKTRQESVNPDSTDIELNPEIPSILPVLPLKDTVVYPMTVFPLAVGQERSIKLIEDLMQQPGPKLVALVAQKNIEVEQAGPGDSYTIGTVAAVHKLLKVPDGTIRLAVQGLEKMQIVEYVQTDPYLEARIDLLQDEEENDVQVEALMRNSLTLFQRLVSLVPQIPDELLITAINVEQPRQLAYLIATSVRMELAQRQELLEMSRVSDKLELLNQFLTKELEVLELGRKIQNQVQDELSKTQREYFLREQLRAIQKELGEDDPQSAEINQFRELIQKSQMPYEARREAERELDRLSKLPPAAAEYGVIKTYLDWLTTLPWEKSTEGPLDIGVARKVLDEDHYDLEKIKERLLEYLAVRKLRNERLKVAAPSPEPLSGNGEIAIDATLTATIEEPAHLHDGPLTYEDVHNYSGPREPILCLVGPPGVGKTSLGQSIARALGRKFTRMSLGGMRDEAEIRGHRRTYIGAMPGRIIQAIRRAESNDPVFMLDEVDKIGMDYRGDPSSALLEVLDPEQNRDFRDHYLDVPFDLSKVMFIATANLLDPIPAPLRDRMEILQLAGYTEEEKVHIAVQHLIPKQLRAHALTSDDVELEEGAVRRIIRDYTREAGVRNLEREIATVLRKIARGVAEGKTEKTVVSADKLTEYLGKQRFFSDVAERTQQPGVATGLAVTEVGGDILFIEATRMPGGKNMIVTGQLGEVMKESAQAALSYVRSKAKELHIDPDFFDKSDIHIHIPAGAIPKDGPSAGITMTTAIASLLTGRPIHGDVAMTGEITLRGKVLPIGGVKEKVLAARRAGIKHVILPVLNERDLDDLPRELRDELQYSLVDNIDQVLEIALEKPGEAHTGTEAHTSNGHSPNGTEKPKPRRKPEKEKQKV
ncbi:MAG TPA: endopeptidase La [Chloroflexia bacterium]|nr:endopeptidase La [Chloroflexia bacterium]